MAGFVFFLIHAKAQSVLAQHPFAIHAEGFADVFIGFGIQISDGRDRARVAADIAVNHAGGQAEAVRLWALSAGGIGR